MQMNDELTAPNFNLNNSVNKIVTLSSYRATAQNLPFEEITRDIAFQETIVPIRPTKGIEMQVIQRPDEGREEHEHHALRTPKTSRRYCTGETSHIAFNFG